MNSALNAESTKIFYNTWNNFKFVTSTRWRNVIVYKSISGCKSKVGFHWLDCSFPYKPSCFKEFGKSLLSDLPTEIKMLDWEHKDPGSSVFLAMETHWVALGQLFSISPTYFSECCCCRGKQNRREHYVHCLKLLFTKDRI